MLHRHLTLEQYELALEEDVTEASRLRARAASCPSCTAALTETPLASVLAAWAPPASVARPVDWEAALRRAVAPSPRRPQRVWSRAWRLLAVAGVLAGLLSATALPAAANAGPNSALFPLRGVEEDVRWRLTPEPDRATLEADLASGYMWQARTSASQRDTQSYRAAMQRFFEWAARLKADIRKAPAAQRLAARDAIRADMSLVSSLTTSGPDPAEARRAESIMGDVEAESEQGDGQHERDQQQGSGAQGQQSAPAPTGGQGASPPGDSTPLTDNSAGPVGEPAGHGPPGDS